MKRTFITCLTVLLLCSCSRPRTAYVDETVDIVAGKDIVLPGGQVLSVKKRVGNSLEGIRIAQNEPDGGERIITADTGTVTQGPRQTVDDGERANAKTTKELRVVVVRNAGTLTLSNATMQIKTPSGGTSSVIADRTELKF